ncbi:MAG: HEPN domain-containing protein [Candidatus Edwardsbacteria bacterium]
MRIDLAKYRIEKAKEVLRESEDAFSQNHVGNSVNRSYYAMFTAARALLALEEKDSSKHSGVIALFSQYIIKPGLFSKELSKFLRDAKRIRENADYGDFVEIRKEEAQTQLENARKFVREAEKTLQKMVEGGRNA